MKLPFTLAEFKILIIIILLAISGMLGTDIHLASLPSIMNYMHTDKQHMQQSISIFLLGMGFSLLFYGPLSDKYGRKPIVIIGLSIAIIASFASIFTVHITSFLITRLLQGVGSGVCMGLGRTMVADVLQGKRLATVGSYFSMFTTLSAIFAPAVGGYLQHWFDWQANFMALGIFLVITLALYSCFCPETNHHKNPHACSIKGLSHSYISLLSHPVFVGCTILSGIATAVGMAYATTSSFILQTDFHLTVIQYGWLTSMIGIGSFVGKFICPLLIKYIETDNTIKTGLWFILLSGLVICLSSWLTNLELSLFMLGVVISTFGQIFILVNTMAKALSPFHDKRGAAGALYGSFQMLVAFIVSAVIGSLAFEGVTLLGISFIILGLIGLIVFSKLVKPSP